LCVSDSVICLLFSVLYEGVERLHPFFAPRHRAAAIPFFEVKKRIQKKFFTN